MHSVAWNREHGWIAVGCDGGLLKILKLEGMTPPPKPYVPIQSVLTDSSRGSTAAEKAIAASTGANVTMNQSLEGESP